MNEYKQDLPRIEAEVVAAMDKRMKKRMAAALQREMTKPERVIWRKDMEKYR